MSAQDAEWLALAAIALHVPGKLEWDARNLRFTNSREKMGEFANPLWLKILGWLTVAIVILLNLEYLLGVAQNLMKTGSVGAVVVGADRIAANGDAANKIGTYSVAVLAKENSVPFYVAAPISTLDLMLTDGDQIPIEQRAAEEVTHVQGVPVAPNGTTVENPAFDVTPNRYVTAIVTERGVLRAPYSESLAAMELWVKMSR